MEGRPDAFLVLLTILVAVTACLAALSLTPRQTERTGRNATIWLAVGATATGLGLWAAQFIGVLAFPLPIPHVLDPLPMGASLLTAVAVAAVALHLAGARQATPGRTLAGAAVMGGGLALIHITGIAAIRGRSAFDLDPAFALAAVLLASGASLGALNVMSGSARRTDTPSARDDPATLTGAAALLGAGLAAMHFAGMIAMPFPAGAPGLPGAAGTADTAGIDAFWMATTMGVGALGVMAVTMIGSAFDAHLHGRTERLNESLQQANAELTHLATHDPLTGLPNRALLGDRIDRAIADAEREGSSFALLFIDLDRFKFVNDSVGHQVGDALLRAAAHRINNKLRRSDTLARLGGDEFVVLVNDLGTPQRAAETAKQVRGELETAFKIDVHELHVSATIGISIYPTDGTAADTLLTNADAAMYHAKQAGRDMFQFFTPEMNAFAHDRLEIENGLRRALQNEEFVLHYQPKVDIATGEVCAMEALVRWHHPSRGLVRPDLFIPVAEETGLIGPIGEWVLRTACRQNRAWQDAGLKPLRIAVNLSAKQFRQTRLLEFVRRTLEISGLEAKYLELELTESTVMSHPEESVRILESLSGMGVHIAIDDFGTGYSSLAYLKRLPLDKLKVDRSFVKDLASNADDASIVQAVISMAHSLRLKVIAEGVETAEQLELLRALGCDEFQGFYFSAAVAAPEARRFLAAAVDPASAVSPVSPEPSAKTEAAALI